MKKVMYHETKSCGGQFDIEQTAEGLPYLVCEKCQHKVEDWITWYKEYSEFWKLPEKWASKRDHVVCLLGWFSNLYSQHYGVNFTLSLNDRGFFRSAEVHQIRKLYASCDNDADTSKKYISWIFEKKIAEKRRKITSLGFLNTPALLNEFKQSAVKAKQIGRNTPLPPGMLRWLAEKVPDISNQATLNDFGDLRTLLNHIKRKTIDATPEMTIFIEKLKSSRVVNENLEISRWSE